MSTVDVDDSVGRYLDVKTKSGFTIRLEPAGFDREGNQLWRQVGPAWSGVQP